MFLCFGISAGTLPILVPLVHRTKTKVWTMWWTNRHGFDILCHGKSSQHAQESGLLYSSHLGIARVTCATLYLYYMIAAELSLWTDFCLFDQRNTRQVLSTKLTSDLNKQQTSVLFSSRKSVTEERISVTHTHVCNLIKQFAKIGGRQKWLF